MGSPFHLALIPSIFHWFSTFEKYLYNVFRILASCLKFITEFLF